MPASLPGPPGPGKELQRRFARFALALRLQNRLRHLLDEQGNAICTLDDVLPNARREKLVADDAVDHRVDVALWQAIEGQRGYMRLSDPGRRKFRPERNEQQYAKGRNSVDNSAEDFQARRVGPMRILEDHQNWILPCQRFHLRNERLQSSLSALLWGKIERRIPSIVRQRQHVGE